MGAAIIGLSQGMLLFLLAAGLTLIFGLLGVVNLAHGSLYMIGAYVAFQVARWSGDFWLALLVSPLAGAAVGASMLQEHTVDAVTYAGGFPQLVVGDTTVNLADVLEVRAP